MGESVKSSYWRSAMLALLMVGMIAAFLYYLYVNAGEYDRLLRISTMPVLVLLGLSLAFPFINSIMNVYLFRSMGVAAISYWDIFLITAASTLANQLPISGGVISKGFYLKQRYGVSYAKFFSVSLALFFCFIATSGCVGVIILVYWCFFKKIAVSPVLLIGFASMLSCFFVFWLPLYRIRIPDRIRKWIDEAVEGWAIIIKNPTLLLQIIGLQVILLLLSAIKYQLAFHMLSQKVDLSETILFSSATVLSQLISIAPGDLGIREAIVGTIASILGFDMGVSVVAVGLDRLISTFAILLLGGISTVILGKQVLDLPVKTGEQKDLPPPAGKA